MSLDPDGEADQVEGFVPIRSDRSKRPGKAKQTQTVHEFGFSERLRLVNGYKDNSEPFWLKPFGHKRPERYSCEFRQP